MKIVSVIKKFSAVLVCVFVIMSLSAQKRSIDSLIQLLPKATDKQKVDIYFELGLAHRGISYASVKSYSLKSYQLSKSLNNAQMMISALSNVAIASVITGKLDTAGKLFNMIFHLADSIDDTKLRNKALLNLGNYYLNTNNYDLALEKYQLVYPEYLKIQDTLNMAGIEENMGFIHYRQMNYRKALNAFFLASTIYEKGGYHNESKTLFNNIGLTYLKLNIHDSALLFFEDGLNYSKKNNNLENEMRVQNNLGLLYMEKENYPLADRYFRYSIQLSKKIVNPYQEANGLLNIAQVYIRKNQFDSVFYYLHTAEPIIKTHGDNLLLKDLNEYYYELFYNKKDFSKALIYYQKFKDVQDSIFSQEIQNSISALNIKFETNKKEAENIRLKSELSLKQITQKRLIISIIAISLLFIAISVAFFFIWKYLKQKHTITKQEALLLTQRLEHSHKELTAQAMHLASQSEFRVKLLETTKEVYEHLDENGKENIQSLLKNLENNIDQSAWHEFETRFEQVHEAFFNQIQKLFPDLTPNDRRICAFLKLNMSTKDIALLTHRSPRSIESARYRLKKKFGLGAEEDILTFLQSV